MDALTEDADEGRGVAAISLGEVLSNLRSGDARMGKPSIGEPMLSRRMSGREPGEVKHFSSQRKRNQVITTFSFPFSAVPM